VLSLLETSPSMSYWMAFYEPTVQHVSGSADVLGQIEAAGWRLEHASWVFVPTGEKIRDDVLAGEKHTVVSGGITGIFLFRRDDAQRRQGPGHRAFTSGLIAAPMGQ